MRPPTELQADALVQDIERQAAAQRRDLLAVAAREAEAIAERTRDKVRRQQQRALEELRHTGRERLRQLRAALETSARHQAAAQARDLLVQAWPWLGEALSRRWADAGARASWIAALVALAAARLPQRGWTVRHPAHWTDADRKALQAQLQRHGVDAPALQPDTTLAAGLVVEADGARLDSTPAALLADRARVEAALLAALQGAAGAEQP